MYNPNLPALPLWLSDIDEAKSKEIKKWMQSLDQLIQSDIRGLYEQQAKNGTTFKRPKRSRNGKTSPYPLGGNASDA